MRRRIATVVVVAVLGGGAIAAGVTPAAGRTRVGTTRAPHACPNARSATPYRSVTCLAALAATIPRAVTIEADLLTRLNQERAARHLAPLRLDGSLTSSARAWSAQMSRTGFRHSNITLLFQGRFDEVAENIAWASGSGATSGLVHLMWMQSPGHRENMLAAGLDAVGVGVYCAPDGTMWATQQFGRFTTSGPPVPIVPVPQNPIVRPDPGSISC